mmetsp:Transcript_59910/g.131361  ORF Transcript_59910/g.131361 Transcript_59910/m.131361 type:complete len:257 (-) Transcript_59910:36-806(-)
MQVSQRFRSTCAKRFSLLFSRCKRWPARSVASLTSSSIRFWSPISPRITVPTCRRFPTELSRTFKGSSKLRIRSCCCWSMARWETGCNSAPALGGPSGSRANGVEEAGSWPPAEAAPGPEAAAVEETECPPPPGAALARRSSESASVVAFSRSCLNCSTCFASRSLSFAALVRELWSRLDKASKVTLSVEALPRRDAADLERSARLLAVSTGSSSQRWTSAAKRLLSAVAASNSCCHFATCRSAMMGKVGKQYQLQ